MRARLATLAAIPYLAWHRLKLSLGWATDRHHHCTLKPRLDPRDVDLWAKQVMAADTNTIIREAKK